MTLHDEDDEMAVQKMRCLSPSKGGGGGGGGSPLLEGRPTPSMPLTAVATTTKPRDRNTIRVSRFRHAPPFIPRLSYVIIRSWRPDELMDIGWGWVGYREGRVLGIKGDSTGSGRETPGRFGGWGKLAQELVIIALDIFFFFTKVWLENFGSKISPLPGF